MTRYAYGWQSAGPVMRLHLLRSASETACGLEDKSLVPSGQDGPMALGSTFVTGYAPCAACARILSAQLRITLNTAERMTLPEVPGQPKYESNYDRRDETWAIGALPVLH